MPLGLDSGELPSVVDFRRAVIEADSSLCALNPTSPNPKSYDRNSETLTRSMAPQSPRHTL